tara:strand:+ start:161 stop:703 length:543 start_codon:yes stop_codon:yes gene_type:complete
MTLNRHYSIKKLRITHNNHSKLINKRFDIFIKQNKEFCDDVWGLIKKYMIDNNYTSDNYYKVFLRELTYCGCSWKGNKGNWNWDDYYYKVYKRHDNKDVYVRYWNNDEMNEYIKLRPPKPSKDIYGIKPHDKWKHPSKNEVFFQEKWKNDRYRFNYYLEYMTPYKNISQTEMKKIKINYY